MNGAKSWVATAVLSACGAVPLAVAAQMTGSDAEWESGRASSYSLIPYTSYGYAGLNLGWADYETPCVGAFTCDNDSFAGKFYTGGMFSRIIGAQIGYINMGEVNRSGGNVQAYGIDISLVANLPLDAFNVFGKIGTTYGWTESRPALVTGLPGGKEDGFGLSYGAGVGFDLTRNWAIVGEWDRHEFRFTTGKDDVDLWSLGVRYKF